MKLLHKIIVIFAAAAAASLFIIGVAAAGTADSPSVLVTDKASGLEYAIKPYTANSRNYFFLPSCLDRSKLSFFDGRTTSTVDASTGKFSGGGTNYNVVKGTYTKAVFITLDGGDRAFVDVCRDKNNTAEGQIAVVDGDGTVRYNGGLEKFKGHGLTSFVPSGHTNVKNSYNIKLESKSELVDGSGKIKKWVLLSPRLNDGGRDSCGLSQLFAFTTYTKLVDGRYCGVVGEYVDLYVNGDYRGVYILCERMNAGGAVEVNDLEKFVTGSGNFKTVTTSSPRGDAAIDAGVRQYTFNNGTRLEEGGDITGGYVLEVMHEMYEDCGFITERGVPFHIKTPEVCTQSMVQYIAAYVQGFEDAIYSETGYNEEGKHYSEYADLDSLADMMLIYAFFENFEYFRTSTYLYKDADGTDHSRLTFGPVWDFETTLYDLHDPSFFGTASWFTYFVYQQYIWSEQLFRHGDFMEAMYRENERLRTSLDEVIPVIADKVERIKQSEEMSMRRWGANGYNETAAAYIDAVKYRYDNWFNNLWSNDNLLYLSIDHVVNDDGTITLTADVGGKSEYYVLWYKVKGSDLTKGSLYANRSNTITVPSDGSLYYCVTSGGNIGYQQDAYGEIFSNPTIKMYSAPIKADAEALRPPETEPPAADTTTPEAEPSASEGGCGSALGAWATAAAGLAVFAAAVIGKKRRAG